MAYDVQNILQTVSLANFAAGGSIGTAPNTVDIASSIFIAQTTAAQTLTIPNPTVVAAGRSLNIVNTGSAAFLLGTVATTIQPGTSLPLVWNGTVWVTLGLSSANAFIQGGNAFGALASIGTSDNNPFRIVVNALEGFRVIPVAAAVNNLTVTNSATLLQPIVSVQGTDANIGMKFLTKGTGIFSFLPGGDSVTAFQITNAAGSQFPFNVDTVNQRIGIGTNAPQTGFHNALASLYGLVAVANLPGGGSIGTAATTVDISTAFTVNQTTAAQTISLPNPTVATGGRIVFVINIGSAAFTMLGLTVSPASVLFAMWTGSAWDPMATPTGAAPAAPILTVTPVQTALFTAAIDTIVRVNPSVAGFTVNLPAIAGGNSGHQIVVKNVSTSTNIVTIAPQGGQTIDNNPTYLMQGNAQTVVFYSDGGTNWMIG
jgi:hypothetical protein